MIVLCLSIPSIAQNRKSSKIDKQFPTQYPFPNDYFGDYNGNLSVFKGNDLSENHPMDLYFYPTKEEGVYRYSLIYFLGSVKQVQDYRIITQDKEKGLYIFEESNGLQFQAILINNVLRSVFEVGDSVCYSEIDFNRKDKIVLRIITSFKSLALNTQSKDKKTKMGSYGIAITQVASLSRKYED
ncbi:MAG: hypothetical protein AAF901_04720 [Bacteroidota bacterium]